MHSPQPAPRPRWGAHQQRPPHLPPAPQAGGGLPTGAGAEAGERWRRRAPIAVLVTVVGWCVFQVICSVLGFFIALGFDSGVISIKDGTFAIQPIVFLFIGTLPRVASTALLIVCHRWITGLPIRALLTEAGRFRWARFGIACAVAAVLTAIGLTVALGLRRGALVTGGRALNGEFAEIGLNVGPTYGWVLAALIAGLVRTGAEELFFRGLLVRTLRALIPSRGWGAAIACAVSAAVFAVCAGAGQALGISGPHLPIWSLFVGFFVVGLSLAALATLTRGLEAPLAFTFIAGTSPLVAASLSERIGSSFSRGIGVDWVSFALLTLGAPLLVAALWGADSIAERAAGRRSRGTPDVGSAPPAAHLPTAHQRTAPQQPAPQRQPDQSTRLRPAPPRVRTETPPSPHRHRGPHLR